MTMVFHGTQIILSLHVTVAKTTVKGRQGDVFSGHFFLCITAKYVNTGVRLLFTQVQLSFVIICNSRRLSFMINLFYSTSLDVECF